MKTSMILSIFTLVVAILLFGAMLAWLIIVTTDSNYVPSENVVSTVLSSVFLAVSVLLMAAASYYISEDRKSS